VLQGTAMVKRHMIWIVPGLIGAFVGYVLISRKIMESKQPAKQPEVAG
jgi:hypothetical protein